MADFDRQRDKIRLPGEQIESYKEPIYKWDTI